MVIDGFTPAGVTATSTVVDARQQHVVVHFAQLHVAVLIFVSAACRTLVDEAVAAEHVIIEARQERRLYEFQAPYAFEFVDLSEIYYVHSHLVYVLRFEWDNETIWHVVGLFRGDVVLFPGDVVLEYVLRNVSGWFNQILWAYTFRKLI